MDPETLKWLVSLGVGGILAGGMFMVYRKDMKINSDAWRGQSEMLMAVVKENTAAITALIQLVNRIAK
jgi:hypothetical protein